MKNRVILCVIVLVLSTSLAAQSISGTVQDSSGLSVPEAEIRVEQIDTGLTRTTQSGANGDYAVTNLPVGPYKLQVTKEGFTTHVQTGIVLQVSSAPIVNIALQVGSVTQSVQVEAGAAMVEANTSGVGQVVDQQRVVDLPLNGRQVAQLIYLSGGSAPAPSYDLNNNKGYPAAVVLSVAGGQPAGVTYVLDGGTYNDPSNNLSLPTPFPDALQEFKVETSALSAQYGHHSTGAVNLITKSGTNQIHGDAFEFVRNYAFNARNFFALERDSLKRNQFGGVLGGPIRQNKLFFFGGYQRTIVKSNPPSTISFVPTAAMRSGDFTTFASAACQGTARTLGAPFVGNRVSPAQFSTPALNILKFVPVSSDPCGRFTYGIPNNNGEHLAVGKIDFQASDKHSILGRYTFAQYSNPPFFDGTNVLTTTKAGQEAGVQSFVLGDTYLLGPATVSSFHATLNRTTPKRSAADFFNPTDMGVNVFSLKPGYMLNTITGGFSTAGQATNPGYYHTTTLQLAEDINIMRGPHQITTGVSWIKTRFFSQYNVQANPFFTFSGQLTGLGLADFMTGRLSNITQGNSNYDDETQDYVGLYVQDSWKVSRRLTINAGIRWEPYMPMRNRRNQVSHFEPGWFQQGLKSTVYSKSPAGIVFHGDSQMPGSPTNTFGKVANFAPRLGVVWDPGGNGRTIVRAAYGIFNDFPHMLFHLRYSFSPPWGASVSVPNPVGGFENPWQGYPGGNPFPRLHAGGKDREFPIAGVYVNMPLNIKPTYMQQWNFAIQRQIGTDWLASASYLGNNMLHGWSATEVNPGIYIPGTCGTAACSTLANINQRRRFYLQNPAEGQYYAGMITTDDGGTSSYNGMLLSLQHRLSNHFSVLSNFTWSHCLSDPMVPEVGGTGSPYLNYQNRRLDRGNCGQDLRKVFNTSLILQAPKYANKWAQRVLGDWQLSNIMVMRSGIYGTVTTGVDNALTGVGGQRPNVLLDSPYAPDKNINRWLNRAAFGTPAAGTYGNAGPFIVSGPGSFTVDVGLSRYFQLTEAQRVEFRAEAFNIANRTNATLNNLNLNAPALFGTSTAAGDPRIMQFAFKYVF